MVLFYEINNHYHTFTSNALCIGPRSIRSATEGGTPEVDIAELSNFQKSVEMLMFCIRATF